MSHMQITLTIGCKVQCTFCPQSLLMTRYSEANATEKITFGNPVVMGFETFKTCLDKMPQSIDINFGGYSESWLHPECTKFLMYAHEIGHRIGMYTTLVGMKIEDIDVFKNIPFKRFKVHLPDVEKFAKISVNKNFLDVLKKIHSSKIKKLTYMTMGTLPSEIIKIVGRNIHPYFMNDRAGNIDEGGKTPKKFGPLLCICSHMTNGNPLDGNVLLPNGDVCMCTCDYGMDFIFGNLVTSSYESLFENDVFLEAVRKMRSNDEDIMCRTCVYSVPATKINFLKFKIRSNMHLQKIRQLLP